MSLCVEGSFQSLFSLCELLPQSLPTDPLHQGRYYLFTDTQHGFRSRVCLAVPERMGGYVVSREFRSPQGTPSCRLVSSSFVSLAFPPPPPKSKPPGLSRSAEKWVQATRGGLPPCGFPLTWRPKVLGSPFCPSLTGRVSKMVTKRAGSSVSCRSRGTSIWVCGCMCMRL